MHRHSKAPPTQLRAYRMPVQRSRKGAHRTGRTRVQHGQQESLRGICRGHAQPKGSMRCGAQRRGRACLRAHWCRRPHGNAAPAGCRTTTTRGRPPRRSWSAGTSPPWSTRQPGQRSHRGRATASRPSPTNNTMHGARACLCACVHARRCSRREHACASRQRGALLLPIPPNDTRDRPQQSRATAT
jgi:hypothetical protein